MVLLSHQFSKLQIYSVEVSNAFLSLHGLKELFNDNAIFYYKKTAIFFIEGFIGAKKAR